jgi:hypothetical protein
LACCATADTVPPVASLKVYLTDPFALSQTEPWVLSVFEPASGSTAIALTGPFGLGANPMFVVPSGSMRQR